VQKKIIKHTLNKHLSFEVHQNKAAATDTVQSPRNTKFQDEFIRYTVIAISKTRYISILKAGAK
jgi:hypothetical protein